MTKDQINELEDWIEEFSQKTAKKKKKANDTWLMDMYQIISFPKGGKTNKKSIIFEEIMEIDFLFW